MTMSVLALDIGGTAVKYGCFGESTEFGEFSVKDSDGIEHLPEKILGFISKYNADRIGISVPGPFDFSSGTGLMEHKLKSLYKISLKEMIEKRFPYTELFFIHDATAFILGGIYSGSILSNENVSGVMLGTGLGYVHFADGRVEVNKNKTPLKPLWNKPYKDGIAENYVSATAIINKARAKGYLFDGVREIATAARERNRELAEIFLETGEQLGELVISKQKEDGFEKLFIGGQVSRAWDLMKPGFETTCPISYVLSEDPSKCPIWGIKYCAERGMDGIYKEGKEQ